MKYLLVAVVALGTLGILGFFAFAWYPAIPPVAAAASRSFPPALITKGQMLAGAGFCAECHTAKGRAPYAGGYPMATPFGTIYSSNITPDRDTGIGTWSEVAFARAMREGVAQDGSLLYPAFPYDHFTRLSDEDVAALYAYFMTRAPVHAPARANDLQIPLNIRYVLAGWRLMFFRSERFAPDAGRSAAWNRGAYLAQGLSHCGACHTPRNRLGAESASDAYAGAVIDNWVAPPLTAANPAPAPWTQHELRLFLHDGFTPLHGVAAGPMAPVVHGLAALPMADVEAIALYIADLDGAGGRAAATAAAIARAMSYASLGTGHGIDADARLYIIACASCHYNAGAPNALRPDLALSSALYLADPNNLIQPVLHGIGSREGIPGVVMPGFGRALSDNDIARIAAYLRRSRTNLPPWPDLDAKIAALRGNDATAH
jgi:mono/diheme cytochrome c family protein